MDWCTKREAAIGTTPYRGGRRQRAKQAAPSSESSTLAGSGTPPLPPDRAPEAVDLLVGPSARPPLAGRLGEDLQRPAAGLPGPVHGAMDTAAARRSGFERGK